jgi:hypothetical protein
MRCFFCYEFSNLILVLFRKSRFHHNKFLVLESISSTFYACIFCTKVCSKPNSKQRKAAQFSRHIKFANFFWIKCFKLSNLFYLIDWANEDIVIPGVNFINVLGVAFAGADPKSVKDTDTWLNSYTFRSYGRKSCA